jgi:hypothetical protein
MSPADRFVYFLIRLGQFLANPRGYMRWKAPRGWISEGLAVTGASARAHGSGEVGRLGTDNLSRPVHSGEPAPCSTHAKRERRNRVS